MNDQKYRLIPSRWQEFKSKVASSSEEVLELLSGTAEYETVSDELKAKVSLGGGMATSALTVIAGVNSASSSSGALASAVLATVVAGATKAITHHLNESKREELENQWRSDFNEGQEALRAAKAAELKDNASSILEIAKSPRIEQALSELQEQKINLGHSPT